MAGKLFIVSAPSGAGKTSLVNAVIQTLEPRLKVKKAITYTSRAPRAGEVSGQDYHFISLSEFQMHIEKDFFLEWSTAYGTYYGSPRYIVEQLESGSSFIMILDRAGAAVIKEKVPAAILIWISVATIEVLRERLVTRGADALEHIERRLDLAKREIEQEFQNPLYNHTILNDIFHNSVKKLQTIIEQNLIARHG